MHTRMHVMVCFTTMTTFLRAHDQLSGQSHSLCSPKSARIYLVQQSTPKLLSSPEHIVRQLVIELVKILCAFKKRAEISSKPSGAPVRLVASMQVRDSN